MKINFLDLKKQHQKIKSEIFNSFEEVYDNCAFSGGSYVEKFEYSFANYIGTKYAVGVSNGTVSLHLAMLALDIGPGDEVIIPANTFIATAWGVSHAGATPVFVDCDKNTWEIDCNKVETLITDKTKAIIGVHLYGQPFDVEAISIIAKKHNLFFIEDAAQAHGAKYKNITVGSFSDMACYSFYPGKNLGACGEGGGITTNNKKTYERLLSLRNHGSIKRYYHDEIGFNYRMSGLQAASLSVKLKYIDEWNDNRRKIAKTYFSEIKNPKIIMQNTPEWADGVFHLFVITTENKDKLLTHLQKHNINPGFHYPVPCHLQKAYSFLNYNPGDMPNSEYLASHCLSLPIYPELSLQSVKKVINVLNRY